MGYYRKAPVKAAVSLMWIASRHDPTESYHSLFLPLLSAWDGTNFVNSWGLPLVYAGSVFHPE